MNHSKLNSIEKKKLRQRFQQNPRTGHFVLSHSGHLLAFVCIPIAVTKIGGRVHRFVSQTVSLASLRIAAGMMTYLAAGRYSKRRFPRRGLLLRALAKMPSGMRVQGRIAAGMHREIKPLNTLVAAVGRLNQKRIKINTATLPSSDELKPYYAAELVLMGRHRKAAGAYARALNLFKEALQHGSALPSTLLDVAACFLGLKRKKDARKILKSAWKRYRGHYNSRQLGRCGDLLFKAGLPKLAGRAYKASLLRFRKENNIQHEDLSSP